MWSLLLLGLLLLGFYLLSLLRPSLLGWSQGVGVQAFIPAVDWLCAAGHFQGGGRQDGGGRRGGAAAAAAATGGSGRGVAIGRRATDN